uniref:Uncharacterized protein n=1 Tax=Anguilla anguilla TaxID=7936 RepID=A0A0E9XV53_ANGAN
MFLPCVFLPCSVFHALLDFWISWVPCVFEVFLCVV